MSLSAHPPLGGDLSFQKLDTVTVDALEDVQ